MKRSLISLAVLAAASGAASAQSSVTVYGVLDLALRSVHNNSGSIKSETGGNLNSNRLGFRGTEDLGGGLRANFNIEADLFPDDGRAGGNTTTPVPAGQFWSRMSWVGLSSPMGEVRLGRDYTPAFTTVATYDPFGYVGVGALTNLFTSTQVSAVNAAFGPATTSANTLVRANNSVAYYAPAGLGGFFASAMVAAGEGAPATGATGNSKFLSGRVGYGAGPVRVEASYAETKNTNIAGQSFKEAAFGGWYNFGPAKLSAGYTELKYVNAKATVMLLGVTAPIGVHELRASYARVNQSGSAPAALGATPAGGSIDDRDASQFAAGYTYNLSKRSALYAQAARVSNKGSNAGFSIPGGPLFVAGTDRKSTAYEFGVRHSF